MSQKCLMPHIPPKLQALWAQSLLSTNPKLPMAQTWKVMKNQKVQFCSHTAWKEFNTRKPRTPYNLDSFETLRGKMYSKICWPCLWTSIQWDLFKAGSHHSCIFSCLGARAMLEIFCSCSATCVRTCTCVLKARHTGQSQTEHIKYMSQSKPFCSQESAMATSPTDSKKSYHGALLCHAVSILI